MAKRASRKSADMQAAIDELDRVFHEKARLGIMTTIVGSPDGLNFTELKELCDLTDGNLNRHLKVLVDTGMLSVKKTGQGRNTNSLYRMTANGRRAFDRYLSALESVLEAARRTNAVTDSQAKQKTGVKTLRRFLGIAWVIFFDVLLCNAKHI